MASVTDLDEALDRAGIPVRSDDLLTALAQVGTQRLVQAPVSGTPLAAAEKSVLADFGPSPDQGAARRARARTAAKTALLYTEALSTNRVAEMIGRSTSRVRHLVGERRLYALPVDRRSGLRLPAWQFTDSGEPVPGIGAVLAALPEGLHPLQVAGFFATRTMELSLDDETPLSPLQWLRGGGDPAVVVTLARSIGRIP